MRVCLIIAKVSSQNVAIFASGTFIEVGASLAILMIRYRITPGHPIQYYDKVSGKVPDGQLVTH